MPSARVRTGRRRRMGAERRATFAEIMASQTPGTAPIAWPACRDHSRCSPSTHTPTTRRRRAPRPLAKYHDDGVTHRARVLHGRRGGRPAEPRSARPGQPFHGLTPEEEKAKLAELRPLELAESARLIGFDDVEMLGYRDSGMPDSATERASRVVPPGRHRRGHRTTRRGHPPRSTTGHASPMATTSADTRIPTTSGCTTSRCSRSTAPATPTGIRSSASRSNRRSSTTRSGHGPGCWRCTRR